MNLDLRFLPSPTGTIRKAIPSRSARLRNSRLEIPGFTITTVAWAGASYVVALVSIPLTSPFTFTVPVDAQSEQFVPVVRWTVAGVVTRYKLWSTGTEILPVDLYSGETIPAGAELEIWAVQNETSITIDDWYLQLGIMSTPNLPTDFSSPIAAEGAVCVISATTLDEMFNACL